jgi:Domain of unknown function (DUF4304)
MTPETTVDDLITKSRATRPRTSETKRAFESLVEEAFKPSLAAFGYRKKNLVWHRGESQVWPVVQVTRHRSDGDFVEFWIEWGLHVPGYWSLKYGKRKEPISAATSPVWGASGSLSTERIDRHWMVALGKTGQFTPERVLMDIHIEIQRALENDVVPFLEMHSDIPSVIQLIKTSDLPITPVKLPEKFRADTVNFLHELLLT